jgi:hypothetical protein
VIGPVDRRTNTSTPSSGGWSPFVVLSASERPAGGQALVMGRALCLQIHRFAQNDT